MTEVEIHKAHEIAAEATALILTRVLQDAEGSRAVFGEAVVQIVRGVLAAEAGEPDNSLAGEILAEALKYERAVWP